MMVWGCHDGDCVGGDGDGDGVEVVMMMVLGWW